MAISLHNDEPKDADALGRGALVEEVRDAALNCQAPQVFGIHGDWGLGKTSFLRQLRKALEAEKVATVWFEAWRYQNEAAPVVALLQEMRSQLSWWVKTLGKLNDQLEVTTRGALLSLEDITKKIGLQASKWDQAEKDWKRENLAEALPADTLRRHLSQTVGKLVGKKKRLVVMIDDLDRCEPGAAFRLLEGLKIYLSLDNCVFVLGMNQKVIEEAIEKSLPDGEDRKVRAAAYLEKLCQNVWRLPKVADPKDYFLSLLPEGDCRTVLGEAIGDRRCLPPNPRRIKGLANLIRRRCGGLADARQARLALIVAYAYQFHPDLFLRWEAWPDFYDLIQNWTFQPLPSREPTDPAGRMLWRPDEVHPVLRALRPTIIFDPRAATPGEARQNAFPDPTDPTVFWVQELILDLKEEGLTTPADFTPFLRQVGP